MIDHVGEHRAGTRRGKHIQRKHRTVGIFRAREREQIGEIDRRIADLTLAHLYGLTCAP